MQVVKPVVVKKLVNRVSNGVSDAENSSKSIGSKPEMCLLTQKLKTMTLRLHHGLLHLIRICITDYFYFLNLNFNCLTGTL